MLSIGSILVAFFGCGEEPSESSLKEDNIELETRETPKLGEAIEKRIEGKPEEAIQLLNELHGKFPNSADILIQLGRALIESKQYALAAFRFDQVLADGKNREVLKEAAQAYELCGDLKSAQKRYQDYLEFFPQDFRVWLNLARLFATNGDDTAALNAFLKGSDFAEHEDCMKMAELYYQKKLLVQAEHWYRVAAKKEEGVSPGPFLGLLRVKLLGNELDEAESLILTIEKSKPGSILGTDLDEEASHLLRQRNLGDFLKAGFSPATMNVTQLAAALLNNTLNETQKVVSSGPKLSLQSNDVVMSSISLPDKETLDEETLLLSDPTLTGDYADLSLADAFSDPLIQDYNTNPLEEGRIAYLNGNYGKTLNLARIAIKKNPMNSEAWRLSSQAHFQLGETREAEMTILEAIRHSPLNLENHLDHLRIAQETLSAERYLDELEKVHELFPESIDVVWQLARRYQMVERMPATAAVLYRKLLRITSPDSSVHYQAEMELIKLKDL